MPVRLFWWLARGTRAGRPRGLLRIWPLWERLARRIWRTIPVPNAPHGVFGVHLGHYRGAPIMLPDGTRVQPGDRVAELHMNNRIVLDAVQRTKWNILRVMADDLRALAAWMAGEDFPVDVEAIYGITVLGRGAVRLGFLLRDRPVSFQARLDRFFMTGLLALYDTEGLNRASRGRTFGSYPQEVWMSRAELLKRYGS